MNSRQIAEAVRLPRDDIPSDLISCNTSSTPRHFLHSDLLVSSQLVPQVHADIEAVKERLGLNQEHIQAFVFPSPFFQAECHSLNGGGCILRLSSSLIESLSSLELQFVIGHELGHFILRHFAIPSAPDTDLESLVIRRYRELSCDRIGLLGCRSLHTSVSAMIKTASGLSERHLRVDVAAFIHQLEQLDGSERIGDAPHNATHPTFLIRCRAILWFSMNGVFHEQTAGLDQNQIDKINALIQKELTVYIDAPLKAAIEEARQDFELWLAAVAIAKSGGFSKSQQKLFEARFGVDILQRLKDFFSTLSAEEAINEALRRLTSAETIYRQIAPRAFTASNAKSRELVGAFI